MDAPMLFQWAEPKQPNPNLPSVFVFVQGSCQAGVDSIANWAAVMDYKGHRKQLTGTEKNSTSNRAEIHAAIAALEALKKPCDVTFYTDNSSFHVGIEKLELRSVSGWMRSKNTQVKNLDLWKVLLESATKHVVRSVLYREQDLKPAERELVRLVNTLARPEQTEG